MKHTCPPFLNDKPSIFEKNPQKWEEYADFNPPKVTNQRGREITLFPFYNYLIFRIL